MRAVLGAGNWACCFVLVSVMTVLLSLHYGECLRFILFLCRLCWALETGTVVLFLLCYDSATLFLFFVFCYDNAALSSSRGVLTIYSFLMQAVLDTGNWDWNRFNESVFVVVVVLFFVLVVLR